MSVILPVSEPKCCSHDCRRREQCARYLVAYAPSRPMRNFAAEAAAQGLWAAAAPCSHFVSAESSSSKAKQPPPERKVRPPLGEAA